MSPLKWSDDIVKVYYGTEEINRILWGQDEVFAPVTTIPITLTLSTPTYVSGTTAPDSQMISISITATGDGEATLYENLEDGNRNFLNSWNFTNQAGVPFQTTQAATLRTQNVTYSLVVHYNNQVYHASVFYQYYEGAVISRFIFTSSGQGAAGLRRFIRGQLEYGFSGHPIQEAYVIRNGVRLPNNLLRSATKTGNSYRGTLAQTLTQTGTARTETWELHVRAGNVTRTTTETFNVPA